MGGCAPFFIHKRDKGDKPKSCPARRHHGDADTLITRTEERDKGLERAPTLEPPLWSRARLVSPATPMNGIWRANHNPYRDTAGVVSDVDENLRAYIKRVAHILWVFSYAQLLTRIPCWLEYRLCFIPVVVTYLTLPTQLYTAQHTTRRPPILHCIL